MLASRLPVVLMGLCFFLCPCMPYAAAEEVAPQASDVAKRPNILFILLDDFGWRDCSGLGSDFYETPNLDSLAQDGMTFTNAYATAANCAPSRACLLSGQYTPRHEVYNVGTRLRGDPAHSRLKHIPGTDTLDPAIKTWAQRFREAGYKTGLIGKWHLSQDPLPYGFDINIGGSHSGSPPRGYFPPHPAVAGLSEAPEGEYLTDRLTNEAIKFIDDNRQRPWLLYLSHFAVHVPLEAKPELQKKYESKNSGALHGNPVMGAMIESVDEGIGRILKRLEELKLAENTIIMFTSDNGGFSKATSMKPLRGYKGTFYEGGIREPLFVKWPGVVKPGTSCDVPTSNVDFYPTLCEMAGIALPEGQIMDGVSLVPLLNETGELEERSLFWHFPAYLEGRTSSADQRDPLFRTRPCSVIRHGKWKLIEYFEDSALELFDLDADIGETQDLSAANPEQAAELHKRLIAWRDSIGAPVPREPNPKFSSEAEAAVIARIMKGR